MGILYFFKIILALLRVDFALTSNHAESKHRAKKVGRKEILAFIYLMTAQLGRTVHIFHL